MRTREERLRRQRACQQRLRERRESFRRWGAESFAAAIYRLEMAWTVRMALQARHRRISWRPL